MKNVIKYCKRYHCTPSVKFTLLNIESPSKPTHSKTVGGLLINSVGNFLGEKRGEIR